MESVTRMFIRARESVVRNTRGQTMTEYALILAAIAVVVRHLPRVGQQHRLARQWRRFRSGQRVRALKIENL
jgi:hypothetical protein